MKKSTIFSFIFLFTLLIFSDFTNKNVPENGKWDLNKKLVWKVETAGNDVFGDIQNIATSEDNRIYVADMKNSLIFIFDESGNFVKSFGKKGEGPGEIRDYFGGNILQVVNKQVIFSDRTMLHYFDIEGNYIKTKQLSPRLKPREFINKDIFISAPVTIDRRGKGEEKIILFNLKTGEKTEIASFRPFDKATVTKEGKGNQMTVAIVIGNITPMMLVKYKNKKIYYGMNNKNELNVCDISGKKLQTFSNPEKKPNKVSAEFKKELKARLGEIPENILKSIINGLPPHASYFSAIHIDHNENIYLFESDPDSENSKQVDIYNNNGKFVYRTEIRSENNESIQYIHMTDNFLYMVTEDEDGNVILSKYRIDIPL